MKSRLQSIGRCMRIIIALNGKRRQALAEVAKATGLSRGTAYRYLRTLVDEGFVAIDEEELDYWLLPKIRLLSDGFVDEAWVDEAQAYLSRFSKRILWPLRLTTIDALQISIRATTDNESPFADPRGWVGYPTPFLESASGILSLAFMPADVRKATIGVLQTEYGHNTQELQAVNLARIRRNGFLVKKFGRNSRVAVPIFAGKEHFACLVMQFYTKAISSHQLSDEFIPLLNQAALEIGAIISSSTPTPSRTGFRVKKRQ